MTQEEAFTKAFVLSEKRARFIQGLSNPRHRKETLAQLSRGLPYQPALGTEVPGHQDFPEPLEQLLRAKGAGPTCHVVAEGLKADGRELPLGEALRLVCLSEFGAILMCVPGRLAYYKPRSPGAGVLLEGPVVAR
jgi:hypothetical protein